MSTTRLVVAASRPAQEGERKLSYTSWLWPHADLCMPLMNKPQRHRDVPAPRPLRVHLACGHCTTRQLCNQVRGGAASPRSLEREGCPPPIFSGEEKREPSEPAGAAAHSTADHSSEAGGVVR